MVHTFVDSALEDLSNLLNNDHPLNDSLEAQIQAFQVDLRLLKMFLSCLITLDPDKVIDCNSISSMLSSIEGIWEESGEGLYAAGLLAINKGELKDWNMLASKLGDKIQQCKQEIKKYCVHLISCSLHCKPFTSDQVLEFLDEILNNNLKHLHLPVENQIDTLKEKLLLLRSLVDFAAGRCQNVNDLGGFMVHVHTWANKAACLTCLYWAGGVEDEEIGSSMINLWLTDLLRKVNPCTPEFIGVCFTVMKSTKSSRSDTFVFGEFVSNFVDFLLLENLPLSLKDDIEIIREGLIFMISFFADPPTEDYGLTNIRRHADSILGDASRLICSFIQADEDLASVRAIVPVLLRKIRIFWRHIQELHVRIPNFSWPKTDKLGFVEHLLGKMEDLTKTMNCNPKIAPFARHQISRVKEELMRLSQSMHVIWELQNEHEELKDLLDKMIQVAYQAQLAVDSSFTIDHPIWYHLSCLSYVLGVIKDVQNEFLKFKTNQIYETEAKLAVPKQPTVYMPPVSGFDEVVVGFDDEKQVLIQRITRGTTQLDIVPIVGMGGLGKTTLAKKLFNESSVTSHFIVRAFCYVGQEHSPKRLLLEILKEFIVIDDGIRAMTEDDLAHRLCRFLKGRRYLIIMDDMWDVGAWKGVKDSFPKDDNGSRVVFTTRIGNVALQAISNCIPHYLRFFSTDESWELLQAKAFRKHPCPPHLHKVGKLIAEKCNGLPLAVVVIAGLLARMPETLSSWNGIADDLTSSYASTLGCMDTQELSYKHLPEVLKSCLLYLGAFVREKTISAKRLMLLWAAEGLVPTKSSERSSFLSLAKQYLNDLVDRSLVIVHEKSSIGGIKRCGVHDLIRDFCLSKAEEEHFFHFIRKGSKKFKMHQIYKQYRICVHDKWKSIDDPEATSADHSTTHTVLYYPISDSTVSSYEFYRYSTMPSFELPFPYPYRTVPSYELPFPYPYRTVPSYELPLPYRYSTVSSYELFLPYRNMKLLHVLDLQEVIYVTNNDTFPEEVTTLPNLRYIALKTERLGSVPSVIANLWNLETFVLRRNHLVKLILPETIWKMKRLRHVDVGRNVVVDLDNEVGKDSSKLPNVESFSSVTIAHGEPGEELLRRLSSVRKLSCCFRSCWDEHRKVDQLPKLEEYLTVLESLNIVSDGVRYPCVFSFPATLKKLTLSGFNLPWSEFSTIAQLPCLEVLKLMSNAFVGSRWDVENEELPDLKFLELNELDITDWIASADTFPTLAQLIVIECHNLVEVPACFAEVATLKVVEVNICNKGAEESAIQIQTEQLDMGNKSIQVRVTNACNIM